MQPDLSEALFMKRSGIKKRERKAEMSAEIYMNIMYDMTKIQKHIFNRKRSKRKK